MEVCGWPRSLGCRRLEGGKITNYTTANGLSSNVVTALLPRSEGTLLIGTQDHGWNLWDGEKFSTPKDSRLNETSIHAILDDAEQSSLVCHRQWHCALRLHHDG